MSEDHEAPFDATKLPDPNFTVPDLVGTVEGWRAWGVSMELPRYNLPPKLQSVTATEHYWAPRQVMTATCTQGCEDIPNESCTCGCYSAKTLQHLLGMHYHLYKVEHGYTRVIGRVANWGKVIEGSQGWRAQHSYPIDLYVPFVAASKLAVPLGKAYGVPVRLLNTLKPPANIKVDQDG